MNTGEGVDQSDIVFYISIFYIIFLLSIATLYLRTMYIQYKNAHDKWHDIHKD